MARTRRRCSPNIRVQYDITAGHDGNMWFSEHDADKLGGITMAGTLLTPVSLSSGATPTGIATARDGEIWATEPGLNKIARTTTAGTLNENGTGITAGAAPRDIAPGPDDAMWFSESNAHKLGRYAIGGAISEVTGDPVDTESIATDPLGRVWATSPSGEEMEARALLGGYGVQDGFGGDTPWGVAPGPDNSTWGAIADPGRIVRIADATDSLNFFSSGLSANAAPFNIAAGPDGAMWFTESNDSKIGRITTGDAPLPFVAPQAIALPDPSGSVGSLYPSPLAVAGLQGTVSRVRVRLTGLFAQQPETVEAVLVDPAGHAVLLLSGVGVASDATGAVLTFEDDGVSPHQLVSGTYQPYEDGGQAKSLPSPAPPGPYTTSMSAFNGDDPNGQWKLYLARASLAAGNDVLAAGWSLDVQTTPPQTVDVPGPTQTVTQTQTVTVPPAPDTTKAKVTLGGVPKRTTLSKFLKGFTIALTPSESVSYDVSLSGTTHKATLASAHLALFGKSLGFAAGRRTLRVKPSRAAVGRPRRTVKVTLRVVATDRGGNRTVLSRTISVAPDPRKKSKKH